MYLIFLNSGFFSEYNISYSEPSQSIFRKSILSNFCTIFEKDLVSIFILLEIPVT